MKLGEARKITAEHLSSLYQKKRELTKILQGEGVESSGKGNFDRVEISKALSAIEEEYEQTSDVAQTLALMDMNIQNAEISRQQSEAIAEQAEEMIKILEVFRRIAKGDKVPAADEKKLMEYNMEMYMAAKNMALMNEDREGEEHDSLWEEKSDTEKPVDPAELAANTEVGNPLAEIKISSHEGTTVSE